MFPLHIIFGKAFEVQVAQLLLR